MAARSVEDDEAREAVGRSLARIEEDCSRTWPRCPGFCPMGCGPTLILGEGGMVGCSSPGCPRLSAVTEILSDPETEHVLEVGEDGWSAKHPLRERLDGQLLSCDLTAAMLEGVPTPPGSYRVRRVPRLLPEWAWERLA